MLEISVKKSFKQKSQKFEIDVQLSIPQGKILAIQGASGCGKTSILRMIAGLSEPDQGYIKYNQETWFDASKNKNVKTQNRGIGFVFQDHAIFPHMTVLENIQFGKSASQNQKFCLDLIEAMDMKRVIHQKAGNLSGGQKQRVSLARALANQPRCLLLDEPFASLDWQLKNKLQDDFLKLQRLHQPTTIIVSHDPVELCKLAENVVIMDLGKITIQGVTKEIFSEHLLKLKQIIDSQVISA